MKRWLVVFALLTIIISFASYGVGYSATYRKGYSNGYRDGQSVLGYGGGNGVFTIPLIDPDRWGWEDEASYTIVVGAKEQDGFRTVNITATWEPVSMGGYYAGSELRIKHDDTFYNIDWQAPSSTGGKGEK